MPDERDRYDLPDEDPEIDDDVPFRLPLTESARASQNIHKDDTEDIIIPDESEHETTRRETTAEIEALHAQDRPLDHDETDDHMAVTMPHPASGDDDDQDVPFHLPRSENVKDDGPIGNKFVTMPSQVPRHAQPTMPGSGGLDPNPDFPQRPAAPPTIQHQPVVRPEPVAQRDAVRFQRPAPPPAHAAPVQHPPAPPAPPAAVKAQQPRSLPRRRRRRFNPGCMAIFIGVFITFCGGLTLVTGIAGVYAYARVGNLLNEAIQPFEDYANFQSTFIYDRNGVPLYEVFGEGRRTNVSLSEMPLHLINATIAIEDSSFRSNIGIDVAATMVAFLRFLGASPDENTPGGSTITQQLVRNVLFDARYRAERSPQRKMEEILLAIALTQRLSKDEILELYLNEIYYGNLAYGAEAAAQVFFNKSVSELTLGEAALLAGLPQAPANLDPLDPDPQVQAAVQARWRHVLNEMVEDNFITPAERDAALREGLAFNPQDVPLRAPHFTVFAQNELTRLRDNNGNPLLTPEEIARGGLQIYTTVDVRINDRAQAIAANQIGGLQANNISNAAVLVIQPLTGQILAMVGSIDYDNVAIDGRVNVTTALRQPGSTMKAFTYSAAIEVGMTPGDVIWDTRTSIGIPGQPAYVPRNYDNSFHGPMRMRTALANSYNIPAVQTLRRIGVDYLLNFMQRFGVQSLGNDASRFGLSLTLGGGEISLLELTRGYAVFANQGVLVPTTSILCILDNDNNIIYQYENGCPRGNLTSDSVQRIALGGQVLDPRVAFLISDILADNPARSAAMGSNSALYTPNIATSVKTGTTDDVKDNWTVGYTRNVAVGVWVGNNNGDPMRNTSGLTGAAPIWNRVMTEIYSNASWLNEFAVDGQLLTDQLQPPPGMTLRRICDVRTLSDPALSCASTVNEWFLDSPAGLPDGRGGLYYPPPGSSAQQPIPSSGSYVQEADPGIYRTVVYRLPEFVASAIQFPVGAGERQPPAPLYCRMPVQLIQSTPGVTEQLFIAPPPVQADAVEAELYARQRGLAFLPTIECSPELLVGGVNYGAPVITAVIISPQPNQVITEAIPIIGTAQFTPDQAAFYKLEIIGGQFTTWTTIGDIHHNGVVNGQLEILPGPPGLQPGNYRLRLAVIGLDAAPVQQPYEVPFIVP